MLKWVILGAAVLIAVWFFTRGRSAGFTASGSPVRSIFGKLTPAAQAEISASPTARSGREHF